MIPEWEQTDPWPQGGGELLIVGPPGTGKTRTVLTHYVLPVIADGGTVLATSYTRAAAAELRQRAGKALDTPPEALSSALTTIHSEAARRVAHLRLEFGGSAGGKQQRASDGGPIEEQLASIQVAASLDGLGAWERVRHAWPEDRRLPVRDRLARLGLPRQELDAACAAVTADMHGRHEDGRLVRPDFTDLLLLALDEGEPRRVDLLCVDEAQDCTPLQWALLDRWAAQADRVLVVGDPDQSIYAWSGADGSRLLRWVRDGRPARRLAQSYRVPVAVHALARKVIAHVVDREDAPYRPRDAPGCVWEDRPAGALEATRAVLALMGPDDPPLLLLARTVAQCAVLVDELTAADMPHLAERGRKLLGAVGAPSMALRVARALSALAAGARVLPGGDARALTDALVAAGGSYSLRGAKAAVSRVVAGRQSVPVGEMEQAGLLVGVLVARWAARDAAWLAQAVSPRLAAVDAVLVAGRWLSVHGADLLAVAGRLVVTTAHASKGREARLVVVDARAGSSAWGRLGTPSSRDEDRRVLYVAITRSSDMLCLVRGDTTRPDWLAQQGLRVA